MPLLRNHRRISEEDLQILRAQIGTFDHVYEISEELYQLLTERWPHLRSKFRPHP